MNIEFFILIRYIQLIPIIHRHLFVQVKCLHILRRPQKQHPLLGHEPQKIQFISLRQFVHSHLNTPQLLLFLFHLHALFLLLSDEFPSDHDLWPSLNFLTISDATGV